MPPDAMTTALDATVRLVAIGLAITGAELFADRRAFAAAGPFAPQVFAALHGAYPPALVAGSRGMSAVALAQVVGAVALAGFGPMSVTGRVSLVVLLATTTVIRRRRIIGGDGAEQMSDIVLISTALACLPTPNDARIALAVVFIAAQAVLSYVTAGIAKLVSPMWRSGVALPAILGTYNHGLVWVSRILERRPRVGFLLGWAVIVFEVSFPLVLFAPPFVASVALAVGLSFHLGCAVLMGLNSFVWPFPATYACVLALRGQLVG